MYNEIDLNKIDINAEPPAAEPARQYYYMAKCREWVKYFEQKNRPLTILLRDDFRLAVRVSKQDSTRYK